MAGTSDSHEPDHQSFVNHVCTYKALTRDVDCSTEYCNTDYWIFEIVVLAPGYRLSKNDISWLAGQFCETSVVLIHYPDMDKNFCNDNRDLPQNFAVWNEMYLVDSEQTSFATRLTLQGAMSTILSTYDLQSAELVDPEFGRDEDTMIEILSARKRAPPRAGTIREYWRAVEPFYRFYKQLPSWLQLDIERALKIYIADSRLCTSRQGLLDQFVRIYRASLGASQESKSEDVAPSQVPRTRRKLPRQRPSAK